MSARFDRRVVPDFALELVRACQTIVPCHLAGGAALAGAYLGHRMTGDIDVFVHDREDMRALVAQLPAVAKDTGTGIALVRDAGYLVRARIEARDGRSLDLDLVYEPIADIEAPPAPIEGIVVESLTDLRAGKLTCVLSRSEPRDLVDLYFLDQEGFPPVRDLEIALRKDSGIDPGVLAWLVAQFPTRPLPRMLKPLTAEELERFRDVLAEALRRTALG
jgi:hypothetical protein